MDVPPLDELPEPLPELLGLLGVVLLELPLEPELPVPLEPGLVLLLPLEPGLVLLLPLLPDFGWPLWSLGGQPAAVASSAPARSPIHLFAMCVPSVDGKLDRARRVDTGEAIAFPAPQGSLADRPAGGGHGWMAVRRRC